MFDVFVNANHKKLIMGIANIYLFFFLRNQSTIILKPGTSIHYQNVFFRNVNFI